jgi:predicted RNA-binding Zn-ribbon protein involved in translation (DUF1610 family)
MNKTKVKKCPNCGSTKLYKADELNPDYVCSKCSALIVGM